MFERERQLVLRQKGLIATQWQVGETIAPEYAVLRRGQPQTFYELRQLLALSSV